MSDLTFGGAAFVNCLVEFRDDFGQVALVNPPPVLERVRAACGVDDLLMVRPPR